MERMSFDDWAMNIAEQTKLRSTCVSRQVGAIIVKEKRIIATGYNGAASGTAHCSNTGKCARREMGFKSGEGLEFCRAGHAESNAIDQCAKFGISCDGATLYVTTQPCIFCTIRIINSGIKRVIYKGEYPTPMASKLAEEAGIEFIKYKGEEQ